MKKPAVLLAVIALIVLAQGCQAATLQSGWYAKLGPVDLYGWDGTKERIVTWNFTDNLGTYGPFQVTSPDSWWPQRQVAVPNTVVVLSGTSVYLTGSPVSQIDFSINKAVFHYETNYDASQMCLELLMQGPDNSMTLLWTQNTSGYTWGIRNVLSESQSIPIGYQPIFKITTVPEPTCLVTLFSGLGFITLILRKRS